MATRTATDLTQHQAVVCAALDLYTDHMSKIADEAEAAGMNAEARAFRAAANTGRTARSDFDWESCDRIEVSSTEEE